MSYISTVFFTCEFAIKSKVFIDKLWDMMMGKKFKMRWEEKLSLLLC